MCTCVFNQQHIFVLVVHLTYTIKEPYDVLIIKMMICVAPATCLRIFLVIDIVSDMMVSEPLSVDELPIPMGRICVKSEVRISYCIVEKTSEALIL